MVSYAKLPIKDVNGGSDGTLFMSTSGPRAALGAVGNLDLSILNLGFIISMSNSEIQYQKSKLQER